MLNLINQDRQTNGLQPVAWDQVAADAGQRHAEDMLAWGYFSHWNTQGWGPDHRYSLAGGQHAVMENLHTFSYVYADGRGVAIEDWPEVIWNAQAGLMNSPGHRANILDPAHTHVGIGMAYDPDAGQFRLAQEFTNHYVTLDTPLPASAPPGSRLQLQGQVNGENLSRLLFSLAYEPFPSPLSLEELAQRSTYMSSAESVEVRGLEMVFDEVTTLGDPSGLYHIRLFVDIAGQQALVLDHIVSVGTP
ncbi:MAG: CAP domain-containing protein [Ardenticatenales bacterium]|nr:CAP domain-containing protein [Ardenticatenales bacterium]